jgi:hypothetical protein
MGARAYPGPESSCARGGYLPALIEARARHGRRPERSRPRLSRTGFWILAGRAGRPPPEQGWKLHVSAWTETADEVLRRTLPVLFDLAPRFKVVSSGEALRQLNSAWQSQVGKFIAVFPDDPEQAVTIGAALVQATRGIDGPSVPSDRRLSSTSPVFYRYGSFGSLAIQLASGSIESAFRLSDGRLEPDSRGTSYSQPDWISDPFAHQNRGETRRRPLVGDRYLLVSVLHRSHRGVVHLAMDAHAGAPCVVKERDGPTPSGWARREADVLRSLRLDGGVPQLLDELVDGERTYVMVEGIAGQSLDAVVRAAWVLGDGVSCEWLRDVGRQLGRILEALHAAGFVHGDVKPRNIMVSTDGDLRLIDFELAARIGGARSSATGTRGYTSREQTEAAPAAITDDIYGFGAVLYYAATGLDPSWGPWPENPLRHPLRHLNPGLDQDLCDLITRCLASSVSERPASMLEVSHAIDALRGDPAVRTSPSEPTAADIRRLRLAAVRIFDHVSDVVSDRLSSRGGWLEPLIIGRDLDGGIAGTVVALSEAVSAFGRPTHRAALATAAEWLAGSRSLARTPLAGLYVGESGVAVALLRAAKALARQDLLDESVKAAVAARSADCPSPDVYAGLAGRMRMALVLWRELRAPKLLAGAVQDAQRLLAMGERDESGLRWPIPVAGGHVTRSAFSGYARGAAGIADALLDLYEASGEVRWRSHASEVVAWLVATSKPCLGDQGANWSSREDLPNAEPAWAHGAGGIARFLFRAAALGVHPDARRFADAAARVVTAGGRWLGPQQFDGLAGNIETLVEAAEQTGERNHLIDAWSLASLLMNFAAAARIAPSEGGLSEVAYIDLMHGMAGAAVAFVKLASATARTDTAETKPTPSAFQDVEPICGR